LPSMLQEYCIALERGLLDRLSDKGYGKLVGEKLPEPGGGGDRGVLTEVPLTMMPRTGNWNVVPRQNTVDTGKVSTKGVQHRCKTSTITVSRVTEQPSEAENWRVYTPGAVGVHRGFKELTPRMGIEESVMLGFPGMGMKPTRAQEMTRLADWKLKMFPVGKVMAPFISIMG
jgi:hypothetical protein